MADEVYGFSEGDMRRAVAAIKATERSGLRFGGRDKWVPPEQEQGFWAKIVDTGPRGVDTDPDFSASNIYWFKSAYVSNTSGADPDDTDAQVDTSKEAVTWTTEPATLTDGSPNPFFVWRAGTHYGEPATTHTLTVDSVVWVSWEWDRSSDTQKPKPRYVIHAPSNNAAKQVKCVDDYAHAQPEVFPKAVDGTGDSSGLPFSVDEHDAVDHVL